MFIIPAIDIFDGQCVRLVEGNFSRLKSYSADPEVMARQFLKAGMRHLHVVDLEGAKEGKVINWSAIDRILSVKGMEVQVGGGVRTENDVEMLLAAGVAFVTIGSVAVRTPELFEEWAKKFGAEKFCVALDVRDGQLAVGGWQQSDELTLPDAVQRIRKCGITRFLSTDIRRDGTLAGPNLELYSMLVHEYPDAQWLASGGVRSIEDLSALKNTGVAGVIIGKAIYEGTLQLKELAGF